MEFLKKEKFKVQKKCLDFFLKEYWFAPQDVLLRSIEANIIRTCKFKHPILDIGIGDGGISRFLFPENLKLDMGIDIENSGLKKALETGRYKKVLSADAQKMPFKRLSFKTVVSNSTFEHITNDIKAVSEVSRVLKKNGYFFLTVPSEFLPKVILEIEGSKTNLKAENALMQFNKRVNHLHYRSLSEWELILKKNDLKLVYYRFYFLKQTTYLWYKLFKISVSKFRGKEFWSYLAHSRWRRFIPQKLVIYFLAEHMLKKAYNGDLSAKKDVGSMLFLIAQKIH